MDVENYAYTFLKRRATGRTVDDEKSDDLQKRKAHLEVEKLEIDVARAKHKQEVEEGKYIPRAQLEIEFASRAAILDAGLSHFFQSEAGNWVDLVGGDQTKLPALVKLLVDKKDDFLNQYAQVKDFIIDFGGE